jgi:SAM-dependent methyltransferase
VTDLLHQKKLLSIEEVLAGYKAVCELYPYIPPMTIWRSWEYAAYKRYMLAEPILDIGCGDGQFFRLVWPEIRDVVGVDINPAIVQAAKESGVYSQVHVSAAHNMPFEPESFSSAFANCSLEHMDNLPEVLQNIASILKPDGKLLMSVVTDKFIEWSTLPLLVKSIGETERAEAIKNEYFSYHHLVSPLEPSKWMGHLEAAGFELIDFIPIVPELIGRLDLFLDNLWHVKLNTKEVGEVLHHYFRSLPDFSAAFHEIIRGFLRAEKDWGTGCGAVFYVRKKEVI